MILGRFGQLNLILTLPAQNGVNSRSHTPRLAVLGIWIGR